METKGLIFGIHLLFYTCLFIWVCISAHCLKSNIWVSIIIFVILMLIIHMTSREKFYLFKYKNGR